MIHRSSIVPGVSKFIDENILVHYSPNSMKRILMAGGVSLYLKQSEGMLDTLLSNPLFTASGVVKDGGMIDIDAIRDVLKSEINKVGFMRMSFPIIGDIDFTTDDIDALYKYITEVNTQIAKPSTPSITTHVATSNIGVY